MDTTIAKKLGQAFRLGVAFAKGRNYTASIAMDRWITIHPWGKGRNADYARIFINDDTGVIESGAGGKFNGKTLKEAFSKPEPEPWTGSPQEMKYKDLQEQAKGFIRVEEKPLKTMTKAKYANEFIHWVKDYANDIKNDPESQVEYEELKEAISYWESRRLVGVEDGFAALKTIAEQVRDGDFKPGGFSKPNAKTDPARLPGERKEVAPIKAGNKEFKDGAQAETAAFMDAFKDGMKGAKNLMDFERYGQGALQKALDTLPDGAVFVSNYEYGYYQKKDGTWYKKDFDDPYSEGGREKYDITEPPSFADMGMMGKVHFGIGGTLEQAEANKQQYDILGAKNKGITATGAQRKAAEEEAKQQAQAGGTLNKNSFMDSLTDMPEGAPIRKLAYVREKFAEFKDSLPDGTYLIDKDNENFYYKKENGKWNKYSDEKKSLVEENATFGVPYGFSQNNNWRRNLLLGIGNSYESAKSDWGVIEPFGAEENKAQKEKEDWIATHTETRKDADGRTIVGINDIDKEFARSAFRNVSHDPDGRGDRFREDYARTVNGLYDEVKQYAETPEQKQWLNEQFDKSRQRILDAAKAYLGATSRTASSFIVGAGNFPVSTMQKRQQTVQNRNDDYLNAVSSAREYLTKSLQRQTAEKSAQAVGMTPEQAEAMKAIKTNLNGMNGYKKDSDKYWYYSTTHAKERVYNRLLTQAKRGDTEFVNKALEEIRNSGLYRPTEKVFRLSEVAEKWKAHREKNSGGGAAVRGKTYQGVDIVRNTDENRLQLKFNDMPSAELRQALKSGGWRWSPRNKAWQRQLTSNAERSAESILSQHFGKSE